MQLAKSGGAHDSARLVQLRLDPPGVVAALRAEIRGVVYREEQPAVLPPVLRLVEVVLRGIADKPEELVLRVCQGHEHAARLAELRTELVAPFVVAPHERELHAVAIGRFEKALFKRLLLRDLSVIPVVVVEENVYACVGREGNLLLHVLWIRAVEISRAWHKRLPMAGEARLRGLYKCPLPFFPVLRPKPLVALRITVPVRVVDADNLDFLLYGDVAECIRRAYLGYTLVLFGRLDALLAVGDGTLRRAHYGVAHNAV